ncbi:MAG: hypothetical protein ACOWWR_12810 [Eubacteriales bacterium]
MLEEFISLSTLSEFPVLVLMVGIITQFIKKFLDWLFLNIFNIIKMPTEIITLFISIILLLSISFARGDFLGVTSNEFFAIILMNVLNAFIVSMAANKGYERVTSDKSLIASIQFKKDK